MTTTVKNIMLVPYDPNWPKLFEIEAKTIKKALGDNCCVVHHVGSTSIPTLASKPKIAIVAVVQNIMFLHKALENVDYTYRGGFNLPSRKSFTKRTDVININLHIFEEDDPEIELNILFRDYLRQNLRARDEYTELKHHLLENAKSHSKNNSIYRGYTLGKNDFIQNILKQAGFDRIRCVFCTHKIEWDEYHRIKEKQIFNPINVAYDSNHPSLSDSNHYHFVLYKGTVIVAIAHVEFLNQDETALRALATDEMYQNRGYGAYILQFLEKWIKHNGKTVMKFHSRPSSERFYRKYGYVDMEFDDPSIQEKVINMGKIL